MSARQKVLIDDQTVLPGRLRLVTTFVCAVWSVADLAGIIVFSRSGRLLVLALVQVGVVLILARAWTTARAIAIATAPFLALLVAFHGFFNPAFVPTNSRWHGLTLRVDGAWYALETGALVILVTGAAAAWTLVPLDVLVEDLFRLRLPLTFVIITTQSMATIRELRHRAEVVSLAQRARGIPVHGPLALRIRSVPALLVPIVVGTLVEAELRAESLVSRGLGSTAPVPCQQGTLGLREIAVALIVPLALLLLVVLK